MGNTKLKVGSRVEILPSNTLLFDATGKIGTVDEVCEDEGETGDIMVDIPGMVRIRLHASEYKVLGDVV